MSFVMPNCDHFNSEKTLTRTDGVAITPMPPDQVSKLRDAIGGLSGARNVYQDIVVMQGPKAEVYNGKYRGHKTYDHGKAPSWQETTST